MSNPKPIQDRLIELAIAKERRDETRAAFGKKFSETLEGLVRQAVEDSGGKLEYFALLSEAGDKQGPQREMRQEAFEGCIEEFNAMRLAARHLGVLRGGIMRTGQSLRLKQALKAAQEVTEEELAK